jgi:hypothetical protein
MRAEQHGWVREQLKHMQIDTIMHISIRNDD